MWRVVAAAAAKFASITAVVRNRAVPRNRAAVVPVAERVLRPPCQHRHRARNRSLRKEMGPYGPFFYGCHNRIRPEAKLKRMRAAIGVFSACVADELALAHACCALSISSIEPTPLLKLRTRCCRPCPRCRASALRREHFPLSPQQAVPPATDRVRFRARRHRPVPYIHVSGTIFAVFHGKFELRKFVRIDGKNVTLVVK